MKKIDQKSKSGIFARAWSLFRKYNLSFSQALKKAWNDFNRSQLAAVFNSIPSTRQFAQRKEQARMSWRNFPDVGFSCTPRNIADNNGALSWYDGKTYNAD